MSYDCEFGVMLPNGDIVHYGYPNLDNPTYNLRDIFCKAMDFEYKQGEWYPMKDMLPRFQRAMNELTFNEEAYKPLEHYNGWGTVQSAMICFANWIDETFELVENIPIEYLYWRW